jgi:hypothetical protein
MYIRWPVIFRKLVRVNFCARFVDVSVLWTFFSFCAQFQNVFFILCTIPERFFHFVHNSRTFFSFCAQFQNVFYAFPERFLNVLWTFTERSVHGFRTFCVFRTLCQRFCCVNVSWKLYQRFAFWPSISSPGVKESRCSKWYVPLQSYQLDLCNDTPLDIVVLKNIGTCSRGPWRD